MAREDQIDERQKERFNPSNDLKKREQEAGEASPDYVNAGLDQAEAYANDPENKFNYNSNELVSPSGFRERTYNFFIKNRNKAATGGILGGVGIVGILMSSLFGPFTLLHNLQANAMFTNDTRSGMLERRLAKVLEKKMSGGSSGCDVSKFSCRQGKMPKKMLERLEQQGIVASDADGKPIKPDYDGSGYAKDNPSHFSIDEGDGKQKIISASDFVGEYKKNPKFRATFKKAYNMRYKAWTGRFMSKSFFKDYLKRDGGVAADEDLNEKTVDEKVDTRLKPSSATDGSESSVKGKFSERLKELLTRSAKRAKASGGDPILLAGSGVCTALSIPRFVTGTVRAIQMIQILALVNDLVISPAGKAKASEATSDQVSGIGKKLTETVDGKSALDSAILLSAIGVNSKKPPVSKFAPGYAILSNSTARSFNSVSSGSKSTCNKITSPAAQVAALGVEAAISVGTGGFGGAAVLLMKGVAKIAITFGAVEGALYLAEHTGLTKLVLETGWKIAQPLINGALNFIKDAKGLELGDVLGTGLLAFFAKGNLAGTGAVLMKDQIGPFRENVAMLDNEERDEALATLSPFDTSSRYTFMGSMVWSLNKQALISGNSASSIIGSTLGFIRSPLSLLPESASAATDDAVTRCDYADDWGVNSDVAIDASGSPCSGIPVQYMNMSPDDVYNLASEGGDNIDPDTGKINPDGKIGLKLADCADGDLESVSGCTIDFNDQAPPGDINYFTRQAAYSLYSIDNQVECVLNGGDDEGSNDPNCGDDTNQQETDVKTGTLCSINDPLMDESSSLAASVKHPGIVYTAHDHLDDDEPNGDRDEYVYAINTADCSVAGRFKVAGLRSGGIKENLPDIEAMQVDHTTGKIWVGDIGNGHPNQPFTTKKSKYKLTTRQPARIVVFDEPDQFSGTVTGEPINITYPSSNQNSEALLVNPVTGQGWIINKGQKARPTNVSSANQKSTLYKLPYPLKSGAATDTGIQIPEWVTDAAFTPDGKWALIRYRTIDDPAPTNVYVYNAETWELDGTIEVPKVTQGESITVENDGKNFLIGSEGKNSPLIRVPLGQYASGGSSTGGTNTGGTSGDAAFPVDIKYWSSNRSFFTKAHGSPCGSFTTGGCSDITLPKGTQVFAISGGKVVKRPLGRSSYKCTGSPNSSNNGGLEIKSQVQGGTLLTAYAHGFNVTTNSTVSTGDPIMEIGQVGNACGAHLHIDMTFNGKPICPQDVFIALGNNKQPNFNDLTKKSIGLCGR